MAELDAVPSDFVLYGGTALALQLAHRVSEDFDFFSSAGFDPDRLRSRLPFFRELDAADSNAWVQRKRDTLEAFVDRGGPVEAGLLGVRLSLEPKRTLKAISRRRSSAGLSGLRHGRSRPEDGVVIVKGP